MKWTPGWKYILPSLLLNHGEPLLVYRANLVVVTIPFLVEDRKRLLFITRLIGSAVDTRETSTRQAKRVRGQQAKKELRFLFSSLELEPGWYSRKKRIEPGLAEPFCPSIQRTDSCAKRCRLFNDIVRKSISIGESHRIVLDSSISFR